MAFDADEKTEAPTPRRRQESREKGQVARSQDLSAATLLLAAFLALYVTGPPLWNSMLAIMRSALSPDDPTSIASVKSFGLAVIVEIGKRLAPLLVTIFIVGLATLLVQVGFMLTLQPLVPSLSKINPINGIKRIFSIRSVMLAVTNIAKLLLVGLVASISLSGSAPAIVFAMTLGYQEMFALASALTFELSMQLAATVMIIALFDYAWQRHKHEKDMKMTKEEVKDELRSMEGDPHTKERRRKVQLQLSMQRLSKDIPNATVVVTNPTHYAIALQYDTGEMPAPKVIAKGADFLALRIRQLAHAHGIPIVERPPLARAMYESVNVGDYVPERFYRAIAEILAYVYELTGTSKVRAATG